MISSLTDFQNRILKWIKYQGFVTWNDIQKISREFVKYLPEDESKIYGSYPEYKIFMPLFRNGCIEVCNYNNKNGFRFIWNWIEEDVPTDIGDPFLIIKTFPNIKDIVKKFPDAKTEVSVSNLNVRCNLGYGYKYMSSDGETGIYKIDDQPWFNEYLYIKEDSSLVKIPSFESDNYDGLNVARTYARYASLKNQSIFTFNKEKQVLTFNNYFKYKNWGNDFPIILLRALVMCNPAQLKDEKFYNEIDETLEFTNISNKINNELLRIIGGRNG